MLQIHKTTSWKERRADGRISGQFHAAPSHLGHFEARWMHSARCHFPRALPELGFMVRQRQHPAGVPVSPGSAGAM